MDGDEGPPPRPLLLLISHARTTNPLPVAPDLTYDLRAVPSPPQKMRDRFSGVDKRLREHMLAHGDFAALLERAEGEVREAMTLLLVREEEIREADGKRSWADTPQKRGVGRGEDGLGEEAGGDEVLDELEELDDEGRPTLRVGVFDVRGRHRSVAFAEELALRNWPAEWEVRVLHRDLGRSTRKGSIGGKRALNRRDSLGRGFLDGDDD